MKRYLFIIIVFLSCIQLSEAQQKISLSDAVEYAVKNRNDIQANKIDVSLAENAIAKSRNEWIPEITANGELLYNTQLQTMVFDSGEKFQMGTKNLTSVSFNLNQPIFKPGLSTDIKINKATLLVQREVFQEKEHNIRLYVVEAYLNVIFREQQLRVIEESTKRYESYFNLAKDKIQLGTILETELLQAQTDYENALINKQKAVQNLDLAEKALKYQMNISDEEKLVLTDSLSVLVNNNLMKSNIQDRPELKQIYYSQQENNMKLRKSSLMWLPTISLVANYTTEFQSSNFNYSQKLWFPYNYVGVKASFSLSSMFKLHTDRREFKLKATQLMMQYEQKKHDLNYEVDKCNIELLNAFNNIGSTEKSFNLGKKLYSQQLAVYKLGTITYSTLLDAESSVSTAELNYITAIYDYLVAYYNYKKAINY